MLFASPKKQPDHYLKIKINRKRLYETDSVIQLRIQIDKRSTWKQQIAHVALKLNKNNVMLPKLRHALDVETLRSVDCAICESHLLCFTWLGAKH